LFAPKVNFTRFGKNPIVIPSSPSFCPSSYQSTNIFMHPMSLQPKLEYYMK